ncbi:hypothetical protein Q7P36_000920 [Cladosporium allicinum]
MTQPSRARTHAGNLKPQSSGYQSHAIYLVLPSKPATTALLRIKRIKRSQPLSRKQSSPAASSHPAAMSCNSSDSKTCSPSNKRQQFSSNTNANAHKSLPSLTEHHQQHINHHTSTNHQHQHKKQKQQQQQQEPSATLWEHFVLHKASEEKVRVFQIDIDDAKPKPDPDAMSPLERVTAELMGGLGQRRTLGSEDSMAASEDDFSPSRSVSSASVIYAEADAEAEPNAGGKADGRPAATADAGDDDDDNTITTPLLQHQYQQKGALPPAFLASLESVHSLSQNTTSTSNSAGTNKHKPSSSSPLPAGEEIIFGPTQELALDPQIRLHDSERQGALFKDATAGSLPRSGERLNASMRKALLFAAQTSVGLRGRWR